MSYDKQLKNNHDHYGAMNITYICVTFCIIPVIDRVIQRKHKLGGKTLTVQKVMEDETDEDETDEDETDEEQGLPATLKILGFKPSTHEDVIQMYFESTKNSGGGEIQQFQMSKSRDSVLITFTDPSGILLYIYF